MTEAVYATIGDVEASQASQDRGIKKEFRNVSDKHDKIFASLEEINAQQSQFAAQLSQLDIRIHVQGERTDTQFEQVDTRFEQVDTRFEQMESRFDRMEAKLANAKVAASWQRIKPVPIFDSAASVRRFPERFPNIISDFWDLLLPENHIRLLNLLHFYDIRELFRFYDTLQERNSEDTPQTPISLDEVRQNPELALSYLAEELGLKYEKLVRYRIEFEDFKKGIKRRASGDKKMGDTTERPTKRPLFSNIDRGPRLHNTIPLEALLRPPDKPPTSSSPSTPRSFVLWDDTYNPAPRRLVDEPIPHRTSPPERTVASSTSKGDTVPLSATPSQWKDKKTSTRGSDEQASSNPAEKTKTKSEPKKK